MKLAANLLKYLPLRRTASAECAAPAAMPAPLMLALEPRIVYDASAAAIGTAAAAAPPPQHHADADAPHTDVAAAKPAAATTDASATGRSGAATPVQAQPRATLGVMEANLAPPEKQVVFIDRSVANYQQLLAGLPAGTQYVVLNPNGDGLTQIAQYLQQHPGVDAIHLVSHGENGAIQVGATWLTEADISAYSGELAQIGAAMKPGGDFLIYGCDVAEYSDGKLLVQQIASVSHLNVAASTDATGAAALGGDWTLEYDVGAVHTSVVFSQAAEAQYGYLLGPPTLTTDSGSASFVSGDNRASTPVVVDSGLTVTDGMSTTLGSVQVQITSGLHAGEDVLSFVNDGMTMGNIAVASWDATTGILTMSSAGASATLAQWQSALRSVTYTDTAVTPDTATRTISFTALDGGGNTSNTAARTVTVTATDQTPIVTTTGGTANYLPGTAAVTIDGGISVSDRDNSTQASAIVSIGSGFSTGDTLTFINSNSTTFGNIVGSYNASTGVLTLTSSAAVASNAQWANALSAVTFSGSSTSYGDRTISFATNDGTKTSVAATDTVMVLGPPQIATDSGSASFVSGDNTASTPVVIDSGLRVTQGTSSTLASVTVSITSGLHAGEDVLSFVNDGVTMGNIAVASWDATTGTLTMSSAGASATLAQWQSALRSVTYTDAAVTPDTATRTISFTALDGGGNTSNTATRTVTVTATDQTPIVTATGGTTNYLAGTAAVTIDGGISVSDRDNSTQASAIVSIGSGFSTGDTLTFINTNSTTFGNIVGSYDATTGVLTMTSSGAVASNAQWANALSAVTFSSSSTSYGDRTISFATSDGTKTSVAASDTVMSLGPPRITTDSGSASFVSGDNTASTPVVIDGGLTLTAGSSSVLTSATVAITDHFRAGEDVLSFTNTSAAAYGDIAASYSAGTGVLTLTSAGGAATLAQWQAALDSVTYTDTAITPNTTTRTVSFTVTDSRGATSTAQSRIVTVAATDQTPLLSGGVNISIATGGSASPVAVFPNVTVTDRDNTTLASAQISIGGGFDARHDVLSFAGSAATGNITASYDAASGVLTLVAGSGGASVAQWQAALAAVTFSESGFGAAGLRTLSLTVSDGLKASAPIASTVSVTSRAFSPAVFPTGHDVLPPQQQTFPDAFAATTSSAPSVLDEFDPVPAVGGLPAVSTITFSNSQAPRSFLTLGYTSVKTSEHTSPTPMDRIQPVLSVGNELPLIMQIDTARSGGFSLDVRAVMANTAGISNVAVHMADGKPLPTWLHFDATRGTLSGTVPRDAHDVRVVVRARDADGHIVQREVIVAPSTERAPQTIKRESGGAHTGHRGRATEHSAAPQPAGKPSLAHQLAHARAALHVARLERT
jgi:hypothetical protein